MKSYKNILKKIAKTIFWLFLFAILCVICFVTYVFWDFMNNPEF